MMLASLFSEMCHLLEQDSETKHWILCKEFVEWIVENDIKVTEQKFAVYTGSDQYGLLFENETDFMAFKLRWL